MINARRFHSASKNRLALPSMRRQPSCWLIAFALALLLLGKSFGQTLPAPRPDNPNPWNGTWKLSPSRSSSVAAEEGVPQAYRFTMGTGTTTSIRWEIPELGEIAEGRTDGKPMNVTRNLPEPGLKLGVVAEGSSVLLYKVYKDGKVVGGGRMMLVDNGAAWVDLTWPDTRQDLASVLVYVRQ